MFLEHDDASKSLVLGFAAMLLGFAFEKLDRDASWGTRGAASPVALGALALALSLAGDLSSFGLDPARALIAVVGAGAFGAVVSAISGRRVRPQRILIIGGGTVAEALRTALTSTGTGVVVGRLDSTDGDDVLGSFADLEDVARHEQVDVVAFAYSRTNDEQLALVAARCRELELSIAVVPRLFEQFDKRSRVRRISGMPLLVMNPAPHEARMPTLSRLFDILGAGTLLLLTLPIWLIVALAIVIEEPGPILYRARRVGQGGKDFSMYKFRKMRRNAAGPRLTRQNDDRFTRVGRFLTHAKLDELPQLINVLRGEMALVGPRPEDRVYVDMYPSEFAEVHRCRPGITGLTQIQYRDEAPLLSGGDFEDMYCNVLLPKKIDLDRYYASRRCLALDLRILVWTIVAILKGADVHRHELTRSLSFERAQAPVEAGVAVAVTADEPVETRVLEPV
jgi:lipopolysaccharide/colanic/teichoic acid biosynthesis glycosyltransferase